MVLVGLYRFINVTKLLPACPWDKKHLNKATVNKTNNLVVKICLELIGYLIKAEKGPLNFGTDHIFLINNYIFQVIHQL